MQDFNPLSRPDRDSSFRQLLRLKQGAGPQLVARGPRFPKISDPVTHLRAVNAFRRRAVPSLSALTALRHRAA